MRAEYITPEELEKLRRALPPERWLPIAVALETGLRVGDVIKIRVQDLDEKKGGVHYVSQKTGKSGFAPLSAERMRELRAVAKSKRGWCFPSPYKPGEHLTRQAVWARVKRAARNAGLATCGKSPHSARKVYAVAVANAEGMRAAMVKLQHDRLSTTELYALSDWSTGENAKKPLLREDLGKIVEKLVNLLR